MNRPRFCAIILFIATCGATAALADTITTYDINFTGTGGGPPPSAGSFTYDSTTQTFSDFTVTWENLLFTLTGSANNPDILGTVPCLNGATGAAASFALLSSACSSPSAPFETSWGLTVNPTTLIPIFEFLSANGPSPSDAIIVQSTSLTGNPSLANGNPTPGTWTITEVSQTSTVPEPNSALLLATLFCAGVFLARKRRTSSSIRLPLQP
ncbi:MAG TPA: PEP-CTERM sorting domain-containing protein [Bryobacteraceae bacterium]|nr:PEP-CTERM sorting domain-containing protein [Bryobacteraceae bacterium]